MRLPWQRGRILRLRPGHLANFSGAAGYMPFIVGLSVPISILFALAAWISLWVRGQWIERDLYGRPANMADFERFARRHTVACAVIGLVAGIVFFVMGQGMVYGSKLQFALVTAVLAFWPMVAWVGSSVVLALAIIEHGPSGWNLLRAVGAYLALLLLVIPLMFVASLLSGAFF